MEKVKENSHSDNYKEEVKVEVNIEGFKHGGDQFIGGVENIELTYNIEIEFRDWGINGIDIRPISLPEFDVNIFEFGDEDDKVVDTIPIKVDFDKVNWKVDWYRGKVYIPDVVSITLTKDKKIKDVRIECFFVDQNE